MSLHFAEISVRIGSCPNDSKYGDARVNISLVFV